MGRVVVVFKGKGVHQDGSLSGIDRVAQLDDQRFRVLVQGIVRNGHVDGLHRLACSQCQGARIQGEVFSATPGGAPGYLEVDDGGLSGDA